MSELLYLYIDKIYSNVNQQSFNFSKNFETTYDGVELRIHRKIVEDIPENFFGDNISNISLVVGKNGVGKSSVLDLLSYSHKNRRKLMPQSEYLVIYHIGGNDFYCEGSRRICENIFKNSLIENEKIAKVKASIFDKGFYFRIIENEYFIIHDNYILSSNQKLSLSYIRSLPDFQWVINEEPENDEKRKDDYIKRNYRTVLNVGDIYQFISSNEEILNNEKVVIEFKQEKQYSSESSHILFSIYHENEYLFIKNDKSDKRAEYLRPYQDKRYGQFTKEYFILRLLEKDIIKIFSEILNSEDKFELYGNIIKKIQYQELEILKDYDSPREEINAKIDYLIKIYYELLKIHDNNFNRDIKDDLNRDSIDREKIFFLINLIDKLKTLSEDLFKTKNNLVFDVKTKNESINFLKFFNLNNLHSYSDNIKIYLKNLSAGEKVYINTFSLIYNHLNAPSENLLLIMDEPDLNFHPEWSRLFVYKLILLIEKYKNKKVQIIITSHSPFLMTDIPRQNIFLLKEVDGRKIVSRTDISFAANLYDLVSASFFLKYPIGEFARRKLKTLSNEKIPNSKDQQILNVLDDPFLKELLSKGNIRE